MSSAESSIVMYQIIQAHVIVNKKTHQDLPQKGNLKDAFFWSWCWGVTISIILPLQIDSHRTYVTATAPFALIHARSTWSAVTSNLVAISSRGASKGPPGSLVIGLQNTEWLTPRMKFRNWFLYVRQSTVCLNYDVMFGGVFQSRRLLLVIVRMQVNLHIERPIQCGLFPIGPFTHLISSRLDPCGR
jgi:hypothetical protein